MNYLKLFVVAFVAIMMASCREDNPEPATPKSPVVELTAGEATATTLSFVLTSENVEQVAYICLEANASLPTAEDIVATGVAVEANSSVKIIIEELTPENDYQVVAAAAAKGEYKRSESLTMRTTALPLDAPTVAITAGEATPQSISFTLVSSLADEVRYLCIEATEEAPTAENILASGIDAEPNKEVAVVVEELKSATDYVVYAVAKNAQHTTLAEAVTISTSEYAEPSIEASLTEDIGVDYLTFSVSATNYEGLRYVNFPKGEREVTEEQAYKNGKGIELEGESATLKVDGLKDDTEYEVHVVAKNGDKYASKILYAKTLKRVVIYDVVPDAATADVGSSKDNFFLVFSDTNSDMQLKLDLCTSEQYDYLPSGEYRLKTDSADHYFSTTYTMLVVNDTEIKQFADGLIAVEATPNEESREVFYNIAVELFAADGSYEVYMSYEGKIEGLELPVVLPDAPEDAYIFEPVESETDRIVVNGEVAGEYYIKFVDKKWNELALDIMIDPAICNDGKDPLPDGVYTLNEDIDATHSYLNLYNPYFNGSFTDAKLIVERGEGLVYHFSFLGTAKSGSTEQVVFMDWSGEVNDMSR